MPTAAPTHFKGYRTAHWQRRQEAEDSTPGPWERWRGSRVGRFVRFAEKYLRLSRGASAGQLVRLLPWQKDFAEEWYAKEMTAGVLGMGRVGAKSTTIAMFAVFDWF